MVGGSDVAERGGDPATPPDLPVHDDPRGRRPERAYPGGFRWGVLRCGMLWPDDGREGGVACDVGGARGANSRRPGVIGPGRQIYRCATCARRHTDRSTSAFRGYRFPDDIIALAVRWYLRFRLPYADIVELRPSVASTSTRRACSIGCSTSPRSIKKRPARIATVSAPGGPSMRPISAASACARALHVVDRVGWTGWRTRSRSRRWRRYGQFLPRC